MNNNTDELAVLEQQYATLKRQRLIAAFIVAACAYMTGNKGLELLSSYENKTFVIAAFWVILGLYNLHKVAKMSGPIKQLKERIDTF